MLAKLGFRGKENDEELQTEEDLQNADPDAETVTATNETENAKETENTKASQKVKLLEKFAKAKDELDKTRAQLSKEKATKRKLYSSLVKLAQELKRTRIINQNLMDSSQYSDKNWYQGGMWRAPELLPGIQDEIQDQSLKEPVSLSDLFFDLVIVTAFTRVGVAIQDRGTVDGPSLAYFAIFWLIWGKEASYSTRFDTTDLSSQIETLLTCFAVLFGSLSSTNPFDSDGANIIMMVAGFIAILHFLLHLRVWLWFKDADPSSGLHAVKEYAAYIMLMTFIEACVWYVGIFVLTESSQYRNLVFLIGILSSFKIPRTFLSNDFHAACSKRGVLFILLLGFIVQSMVMVSTPFFDYQMPNWKQYSFLGLACFLMFCIKLLYVDDSYSVNARDHALLVSRLAGFFFHVGQFTLLLSTTVLGAGLNLLTHSYLSATSALSDNDKTLVCGGFTGVILSIAFIKSMHIRRVPLNTTHKRLFYAAYAIQLVVLIGIVYTTTSMMLNKNGFFGYLYLNEIEMLSVLSGLALFFLMISWLDEAVELSIYGEADAREFRVHPFGLWMCIQPGEEQTLGTEEGNPQDKRLSHLSPLLSSSKANLFDSQSNFYDSIRSENGADAEGRRTVTFDDNGGLTSMGGGEGLV